MCPPLYWVVPISGLDLESRYAFWNVSFHFVYRCHLGSILFSRAIFSPGVILLAKYHCVIFFPSYDKIIETLDFIHSDIWELHLVCFLPMKLQITCNCQLNEIYIRVSFWRKNYSTRQPMYYSFFFWNL